MGDSGLRLLDLPVPAFAAAEALNRVGFPGLEEAVASYECVGLYGDVGKWDLDFLEQLIYDSPVLTPHEVVIPVCYELGPDLLYVTQVQSLTTEALIEFHSSVSYQCYAVGFCPGFAYLGYLPDALSGVPRLAQPRLRTPAGSVGITGRQTAVYPLVRPGGWPIIGQTPCVMVDPEDDYFPIQPGATVRFRRIEEAEYARLHGTRVTG
jgi:inhibitor of KinA